MIKATNEITVDDWERARAHTKEYLDAMAGAAYAFKPTPDIRSFAEQMLHVTDLNYALASAASGKKSFFDLGELENDAR